MTKKMILFFVTSAFSTSLLFAQGSSGPSNPPDPAKMVQWRVDRLTKQLGLNATQQSEATTIFTNAATQGASIPSSMKAARDSLRTAVQNNDLNAITQVSQTIGGLTSDLTSIEAKAEAALYQILTPDQQAKLGQGGGMEPMGGPGPGPMGNGFGPRGRGGR